LAATSKRYRRTVDPSILIGTGGCFLAVGWVIHLSGNAIAFLDIPSILVVFCGTLAVTIACFSITDVLKIPSVVVRSAFYRCEDLNQAAFCALELAEIARKKGFLGLNTYTHLTSHNSFLKDGVDMIVDNVPVEEAAKVLDHEISSMADTSTRSISVLRKAAEVAPAMGLIGTLIGLVQMLSHLEDPSVIGPAMAIALLTTFYGAMLSYALFSPLASKLERNVKDELLVYKIYFQAILSILNHENPRKLELVINGILPPARRIHFFDTRKSDSQSSEQG